jgi:hypothetical protein
MLSDRERRELAMIEHGLRADDRRFVDAFRTARAARGRPQHRWPVRALIGFGILLVVVGLVTGADELFMQGLLYGGAGVAWSRWRARRAAAEPPGGGPRQPSPRPGPRPPEGFRPV